MLIYKPISLAEQRRIEAKLVLEPINKVISTNIFMLRVTKGWTRMYVYELTGVDETQQQRIESGKQKNPTLLSLMRFASAYGLAITDLFKEGLTK